MRPVDHLARQLFAAGCRYAFGIPGGEVLALVDALEEAGIRFILTKHENTAGFMAEGVWHRTGAPGLLVATLGPGAMNGVNVVANAFQDKVPLIVLTGCVDEDEALTYTHQVMDHKAVFTSITKASLRLTSKGAAIVADKAVSIATDDRAGPVHIDLPISVAEGCQTETVISARVKPSPVAPAKGPALDQALVAIACAKRPLIVAGLDVVSHKASAELKALAEHIGAPVITTYKAKGTIPEDHALCLGAAGLSPKADAHLLPLIAKADVILAIGYDPIEMRAGWRNPWDPRRQTVIELSAAGNDHYVHHASHSFICNVGAGLKVLKEGLSANTSWKEGEPAKVQASLKDAFTSDGPWGPGQAIQIIQDRFPRDTIATADSGAHRILQSQIWQCYEPATLLQSSGLCTMGCAVPLAMGAKIAEPDRPVVAFTGDAGLLMILGELATAAELNLSIVIVVFVDASLALIDMKQRAGGLGRAGVDFGRFDFAAIAQTLGGNGVSVSNRADLSEAIDSALNADTFTVIACQIGKEAYDGTF
jgi:acetolactate synthase I/II/III large subunit